MNATQIIVLRHGETAWNVEGRYQGHLDSPLTAAGLAQGEAMAQRLAHIPFSALYSSDLGRARQTAELIGVATGQAIGFEPDLRERHLGIFQASRKRRCHRASLASSMISDEGPDHIIPEGESARQRYEIVTACLGSSLQIMQVKPWWWWLMAAP
jgi:probable phosphoglycerate mutase